MDWETKLKVEQKELAVGLCGSDGEGKIGGIVCTFVTFTHHWMLESL